jgi:hypothetical protein
MYKGRVEKDHTDLASQPISTTHFRLAIITLPQTWVFLAQALETGARSLRSTDIRTDQKMMSKNRKQKLGMSMSVARESIKALAQQSEMQSSPQMKAKACSEIEPDVLWDLHDD